MIRFLLATVIIGFLFVQSPLRRGPVLPEDVLSPSAAALARTAAEPVVAAELARAAGREALFPQTPRSR